MRILLILGHSNPFAGAAWRRIEHFAQSWSSEGHQIDVLGVFSWKTLHQRGSTNHTGYQTHNIIPTINLVSIFAFILNYIFSLVSVFAYLILNRPSLVVVSMPPGSVGVGSISACILTKHPFVIDYRDEWESVSISSSKSGIGRSFRVMINRIVIPLYNKSKHIVTVTNSMAKNLHKRGVREILVIMNGADLKTFTPPKIEKSQSKFTLIFIGGFDAYYRLEIILKAITKLVTRGINNLNFLFAGSGDIDRIMTYARTLRVDEMIHYLGVIDDKNTLVNRIQSANIGLIPYDNNPLWKHTLPAKLFEYCACGVPVLATSYSDSELARVILDNKIGLVTPPLDSDSLADAIQWMMQNPEEIETYGTNARNLVVNSYDRKTNSRNFLSILRSIARD